MAFCELHFFSPSLGRQSACTLLIPQGVPAPWATFYLLHGMSDDHTIWTRRTSLERYVEGWPLLVVMPENGGNGFYTDAHDGSGNYESLVLKDLLPFIETTFPVKKERAGRCIGGLSMGGYGAMKLALKHPDLFCSANSHSGAVSLEALMTSQSEGFSRLMRRLFGENAVGSDNDPFALATRSEAATRPALKVDCGVDDFLIEENRAFHRHLERLGIAHDYDEFPGAHDWSYWDTHIQNALAFHRKNLSL